MESVLAQVPGVEGASRVPKASRKVCLHVDITVNSGDVVSKTWMNALACLPKSGETTSGYRHGPQCLIASPF